MELPKYKYDVDLLKIFSRNYQEDGSFEDINDVSNAKFYNVPSQMSWPEGTTHHDCHMDDSGKNYGFLERVQVKKKEVGRVGQDIPRYPFKNFKKWNESLREMIAESCNTGTEVPDIICNLSCLVALMSPSQDERMITAFKAKTINLQKGKRAIYLKHGFQSKYDSSKESYGHYWENELACRRLKTEPLRVIQAQSNSLRLESSDTYQEVKYEIPASYLFRKYRQEHLRINLQSSEQGSIPFLTTDTVNGNHIVETLYGGTLTSPQNQKIKIAFTAETDGLWAPPDRFNEYTEDDITEMKSVDLTNLTPGSSEYYFEENILRKFYCQSRIRGIEYFLCNFVAEKSLKEEWLYDVNQIPKVIEKCSNKTPKQWNRAFPKGLLSLEDQNICQSRQQKIKKWTEEDCFRSLYLSLEIIMASFSNNLDGDTQRYFIQDGLTIQKHNFGIERIDIQSYDEAEVVNRRLLIKFFNKNLTLPWKEKNAKNTLTQMMTSWKPEIQCATEMLPSNHTIYKDRRNLPTDILFHATFRTVGFAKTVYKSFWKNKNNGLPPYNVSVFKSTTGRQNIMNKAITKTQSL